jgi:hypothetical protein
MRKFNILAAVAATMLVGGIAVAKDKPEAPKEKKICQVIESANGRIPERRICKTKAEWEASANESQRADARPSKGNRSTGRD